MVRDVARTSLMGLALLAVGAIAQPTDSEAALRDVVCHLVVPSGDGFESVIHERAIAVDPIQGITSRDEIVQSAATVPDDAPALELEDLQVWVFGDWGYFTAEQTSSALADRGVTARLCGLAYHTPENGWQVVSFGNIMRPLEGEGGSVPRIYLRRLAQGEAALPEMIAAIDESLAQSDASSMSAITHPDAVLIGINPEAGGRTLLSRDEAAEIGERYHPAEVTFERMEDEADLEWVGVQVALSVRTYRALGTQQPVKVRLITLLWWDPDEESWLIISAGNAILPL